ncbi:PH domain-containing protein [Leucobacter insecticola]|uniref:PH domain-containing protein n=1 Tax=Leucobacter insecticola TaxID=2714934 RepID=A0A6G8FLG1_9MICO|nr:PH domain-containing protein [Leucobacter insecticola]QIM17217.1 PH domain-containing protein [Leucobacter insecticola]
MTALPGTADAEGWRRLHPLSPLLRGGIALIVIAGIIIANFRDRIIEVFFAGQLWESGELEGLVEEQDMIDFLVREGLLLLALGIVLGVIALIVLFSWIAWRFHTYRITDEAVEARSGVVFRNHRRAPLERIQSVNLQRPLLARALGLTKIEVLTAGTDGKVELAYLGHRDAKIVREQIVRQAATHTRVGRADVEGVPGAEEGGSAASGELQAPAPVGYGGYVYADANDKLTERAHDFIDVDVDPKAIVANTLVKVPAGRLLGSIALGWESIITVLILLAVIVLGATLTPEIIFGIIPLGIVMVSILFAQFNKGFNFTLSRSSDAVRTGAGLTATTTETIPFGRIHAIEARQPLMWRPLGWWKVRITMAGHSVSQGGQNSSQNLVLPVGFEADVVRVIATVLPGVDGEIEALRDGLSGAATDYLGAGPRAGWVLWWGRRRAGIRIEGLAGDISGSTLRIRRGALNRSLSLMPIVRAQSVQLRRPFMHRFLGLASVQAHTVLGPVRMEMRGLGLGAAQKMFDELEMTVLRVQGMDAAERAARGEVPEPVGTYTPEVQTPDQHTPETHAPDPRSSE